MTVKLVHVTKDGDELIAYMARVSNPSNQSNPNNSKLIKYLIKHKHWSPFEMVNMCVEINTTRSISAQILRHRSFSFQEFSQRYAEVGDPIFPALRRQDLDNRQNSIDDIGVNCQAEWFAEIASLYSQSSRLYKQMLKAGIAKECAREILPLASPTKLYMNGTLRSWFHYIDLRSSNGTQLEHQTIANQVKLLVKQHFPNSYLAFFSHNDT
jgi:thymidylate synthase (FAD)